LLLIDGHDDILLTESASEKVLQRICAAGGHAQRKVYPGLGHDAVVYGSLKDQMDWIAAPLFRRTGAEQLCAALNKCS